MVPISCVAHGLYGKVWMCLVNVYMYGVKNVQGVSGKVYNLCCNNYTSTNCYVHDEFILLLCYKNLLNVCRNYMGIILYSDILYSSMYMNKHV